MTNEIDRFKNEQLAKLSRSKQHKNNDFILKSLE